MSSVLVPWPAAALDLAGLADLIVTDLPVQIVPRGAEAGLGLGEAAGAAAVLVALRNVRQEDRPGPAVFAADAHAAEDPADRKLVPDHLVIVGRGFAADHGAAHGEVVGHGGVMPRERAVNK